MNIRVVTQGENKVPASGLEYLYLRDDDDDDVDARGVTGRRQLSRYQVPEEKPR